MTTRQDKAVKAYYKSMEAKLASVGLPPLTPDIRVHDAYGKITPTSRMYDSRLFSEWTGEQVAVMKEVLMGAAQAWCGVL